MRWTAYKLFLAVQNIFFTNLTSLRNSLLIVPLASLEDGLVLHTQGVRLYLSRQLQKQTLFNKNISKLNISSSDIGLENKVPAGKSLY